MILDNAKTTLSGQSSFRQEDSILFFASGLDPKSRHDLQVVNEDGRELSLRADGFHVFASGSPKFAIALFSFIYLAHVMDIAAFPHRHQCPEPLVRRTPKEL